MTVLLSSGVGLNSNLVADVERVSKNTPSAKRQLVCTRGVFPTDLEAGGGAKTRFESHVYIETGESACSSLKLHYASLISLISGDDSTTGVANFSLQAVIAYNSSFAVATFNGTKTTPVESGVTMLTSNPIGVYIPAKTEIRVKTGAITAAGLSIPAGMSTERRTKKVASTAATSQIFSYNNISTPAGGSDTALGLVPVLVTGIPEFRHVAIAGWGDSLMQGTGDITTNLNGATGWFEHACMDVDGAGRCIPFVNLSRAGDKAGSYADDMIEARFAYLEYVTHVVFGMGNNDIMAGRTLAQIQAGHLEAWAHAKLFGCKVGAVTLTPRTTSTDGWATVANQTPESNYTTAGIRGQFNAWLVAQKAAGVLDFIIDINSVAADTTNPDVFKAGFTYDGTHWGNTSTLTVGSYAKTQLLKLKV